MYSLETGQLVSGVVRTRVLTRSFRAPNASCRFLCALCTMRCPAGFGFLLFTYVREGLYLKQMAGVTHSIIHPSFFYQREHREYFPSCQSSAFLSSTTTVPSPCHSPTWLESALILVIALLLWHSHIPMHTHLLPSYAYVIVIAQSRGREVYSRPSLATTLQPPSSSVVLASRSSLPRFVHQSPSPPCLHRLTDTYEEPYPPTPHPSTLPPSTQYMAAFAKSGPICGIPN